MNDDFVFTYELGTEEGHTIYGNVSDVAILNAGTDEDLKFDINMDLYSDSKEYELPPSLKGKYLDILLGKFKIEVTEALKTYSEKLAEEDYAKHRGKADS